MDLAPAAGRTHDLTAARTHRIIRICERQGVPVLTDRTYIGAGSWVTTPIRPLPDQDLNPTQRTINRALSAARAPVERSVAQLKSWRDLPQGPLQPQPPVVNLRRCPHPGASTLKTLTEASFAALCGVSPVEYSSGRRSTRRLNYGGDRQANAALHRIVFTRLRHHPRTQAYYERRTQEGKTRREIIRCLKRYAAREVFNLVRPAFRTPAL